ncbi:tripartite tricarboxylate transporter TctB family protein [Shouchella sp. 1P09AA]|uniref:tripartite tricarboxylate transporter TctB family protein n=1 Tax=unclassified Shouchella TaxID=2893065 RepID=UPI0039A0B339
MGLTQERVIGIVVAMLGLAMFLNTLTMSFMILVDDPGPILLPRIVSIALFLCGLGLIFSQNNEAKPIVLKLNANSKRMGISFLALLIYGVLFNVIGYMLSTFLFLSFLTWYLSKQKGITTILKSISSGIVVTAIIYLVFTQFLDVLLPRGVF